MDPSLGAFVLDSLDFAVFVLDETRRICLMNQRARSMTARRDALCCAGAQLQVVLVRDQRVFESYVARTSRRVHGECAPLALALLRSSGRPDYQLTARRLSNDSPYFYVTVHEPSAPRSLDPDMLRQLHGMTPTEAAIVSALFAGSDVKQLTQQLGTSANTVRTHLKSVYAKCEVSSQAQLLKLLALGPHRTGETPAFTGVRQKYEHENPNSLISGA